MVFIGPITKYVLTVAPSMEHVKHGLWVAQTILNKDQAMETYRAFVNMGAICYLETITTEKVNTLASCDEIREYWD